MPPARWEMHDLFKAMLWEELKGKLRAMVAVQGSFQAGGPPNYMPPERDRWNRLKRPAEDFIREVENYGLHE